MSGVVGSLALGSPRFWIAVLGGVLASAAVILILLKAVETATTPAVSLASLKPTPILSDKFLTLHESIDALKADYMAKINERQEAAAAFSANPSPQTKTRLQNANADWDFLQKVFANVLEVATYFALADTWRRATKWIAAAAIVAALGVVMLVWAINPPKAAEGSSASPAVLASVTPGTIHLSDAGQGAVRAKLGEKCSNKRDLGALLLDETQAGPDVLVQEPGCNALRLVLGSDWGSFQKQI